VGPDGHNQVNERNRRFTTVIECSRAAVSKVTEILAVCVS
jgi:hypothetical protein